VEASAEESALFMKDIGNRIICRGMVSDQPSHRHLQLLHHEYLLTQNTRWSVSHANPPSRLENLKRTPALSFLLGEISSSGFRGNLLIFG
jgi:hypothetical protein